MTSATAFVLASICLPGQVQYLDVGEYTKEQQLAATLATVRIRNGAKNREGSGVIIGKSTSAFYVLTAQHLVDGADRLEVSVFAKRTYPRPHKTYAAGEKMAEARGMADLAILRVATNDDVPAMMRVCPEAKLPKETSLALLTVGCDIGLAPTLRSEKNVAKKLARRPGAKEQGLFWEVADKYPSGRSGGPLVDRRGRLLGVCSGTNRDRTYFTHASEIHQFLKKHGYRWLLEEKTE